MSTKMKMIITAGVILAVIAMITTVPIVNAYTTVEIAQLELKTIDMRAKNVELAQRVYTNVTRLSQNISELPNVGGQIIGLTLSTALLGGEQSWTMLKIIYREFMNQVTINKENLGLPGVIISSFVAAIGSKVLPMEQTIPEGRVIAGLHNGMTIEEIMAPIIAMGKAGQTITN